ncbi:MAG: hypothetical protein KDC26_08510 [Armatimonadetes bacterium]|nr:hypothetical protein [Armatimonadota bacterium]
MTETWLFLTATEPEHLMWRNFEELTKKNRRQKPGGGFRKTTNHLHRLNVVMMMVLICEATFGHSEMVLRVGREGRDPDR